MPEFAVNYYKGKCQCESAKCQHNQKGKFVPCSNKATERVRLQYGEYMFCSKCANEYEKNGYIFKREKL